jgi:hypothetical protein
MAKAKKKRKWTQTVGTFIEVPCPADAYPDCEGAVELHFFPDIGKKRLKRAFEEGSIELTEDEMRAAGVIAEEYRDELDARGVALVSADDAGLVPWPCSVCEA